MQHATNSPTPKKLGKDLQTTVNVIFSDIK